MVNGMTKTQPELQDMMIEINNELKKIGLTINFNKTNVIFKEDYCI